MNIFKKRKKAEFSAIEYIPFVLKTVLRNMRPWIILAVLFIVSIVGVSLYFSSDEPVEVKPIDKKRISLAISDGYYAKEADAMDYVIEKINERYPDLSISKENQSGYDDGYWLIGSNEENSYSIKINFEDCLNEYTESLCIYAYGVDGLIAYFEDVKEGETIRNPIISVDLENDSLSLADDASNSLYRFGKAYRKEDPEAYMELLRVESYHLFDYNDVVSDWNFEISYDEEKKEYSGQVMVPIKLMLSNYRKEEIEELSNYLTLHAVRVKCENNSGDVLYKNEFLKKKEINNILYSSINNFYADSIGVKPKGVIISGHVGTALSDGWDYETASNKDISKSYEFWNYAASLRSTLNEYPYANLDYNGNLPENYSCSIFAAVFFYDVYGFSALRGDGNQMADNLLRDCGIENENACPIRFTESGDLSPGSIISFYPNHVAVIVSIKEDGSIVLADGNVLPYHTIRTGAEYGSLEEYCIENYLVVKTIAVPVN